MVLGYANINSVLQRVKPRVICNRTMRKSTYKEKGLSYVSELIVQNTSDLLTVLKWNAEHKIKLFRIAGDMFPWASEYAMEDLPDYDQIAVNLKACGDFTKEVGMRITTHPGHFNVPGSLNENTVRRTFVDLQIHSNMFDLMGLSRTHYNPINIHCNGVFGDKIATMDRFAANFEKMSDGVKSRLTIENDDKESMYSVVDLMYLHEKTGIPILFDYHHHKFCTGGLSEEEALKLAISTWPKGIKPVVHYSESKAEHENNPSIKPQAHSDLINQLPNLYGQEVDVMVEAKGKEQAILPFIN